MRGVSRDVNQDTRKISWEQRTACKLILQWKEIDKTSTKSRCCQPYTGAKWQSVGWRHSSEITQNCYSSSLNKTFLISEVFVCLFVYLSVSCIIVQIKCLHAKLCLNCFVPFIVACKGKPGLKCGQVLELRQQCMALVLLTFSFVLYARPSEMVWHVATSKARQGGMVW